jgi:hypothetical protein
MYREELSQARSEFRHLKPWRGVRIEDRFKVIWEGDFENPAIFDLVSDPHERNCLGACLGAATVPPTSVFARYKVIDAAEIRKLLKDHPPLLSVFDKSLAAFLRRPEVGIAVSGSLCAGRVDRCSDLDFELFLPNRQPVQSDVAWVLDCMRGIGPLLTWFLAGHIRGRENMLVIFLEFEGAVVKVDVNLQSSERLGSSAAVLYLRLPAAAEVAALVGQAAHAFDLDDTYRKFTGWIWYVHCRLARGEILEAADALAHIRSQALVPVLLHAHRQPQEGYRRIEERLPSHSLVGLRSSYPRSNEPAELRRCLNVLIDGFVSATKSISAGSTGDHQREANLDAMRCHLQMDCARQFS